MTTISPGSMSRTKRAPMISSAQVSEARIGAPSRSPRISGRTPKRIAAADHLLGRQPDQRIGALDARQRIDDAIDQRSLGAGGDEVEDHLGIGGRLEDRSAALQLALERQRVGEVAVVGDGEAAAGKFGEQRLDVAQAVAAVGRVADVADGAVAGQAVDDLAGGEVVADEAGVALGMEGRAVEGDDAAGFLPAMLKRVQAERGQRRGVLMAEDAEHAALLVQLVVIEGKR